MTEEPPAHAIDWQGNDWTPRRPTTPAAHPNARFTRPGRAGPGDRARLGGPEGRADRRDPLRRPPLDRRAARPRGVRLGARRLPRRHDVARRRRPPRPATVGELRRDPMAMLPFCGYHMADYFGHWLEIGAARGREAAEDLLRQLVPQGPEDGRFLWPGFGENSRVLEWVFRRCDDAVEARDTPIGRVPTPGSLNTDGPRHRRGRPRADPRRRPRAVAEPSSRPCASSSTSSATACPPALAAQLDALEERLNAAYATMTARGDPARPDRRAHCRGARRAAVRAFAEAFLRRLAGDGDGDGGSRRRRCCGEIVGRCSSFADGARRASRSRCARSHPTLGGARLRDAAARSSRRTRRTGRSSWTRSRAELRARGLGIQRVLHPIVGIERDGDGAHRRGPAPARGVARASRSCTSSSTGGSSPRSSRRSRTALRGVLGDVRRAVARLPGDGRPLRGAWSQLARGRGGALRRRRGRRDRRLPRVAAARATSSSSATASTASTTAGSRSCRAPGSGFSPTPSARPTPSPCRSTRCRPTCASARSRATC